VNVRLNLVFFLHFICFERGFTDYGWHNELTMNSIYFVTRLKSNADVQYLLKRAERKTLAPPTTKPSSSKTLNRRSVWFRTPVRKPELNIALPQMLPPKIR